MKIFGILFIVGFALFSCRKEQPEFPISANPCEDLSSNSVDFVVEERLTVMNGAWVYIPTDTTFHSRIIRFRGLVDGANYHWYIGSQEYYEQDVALFFAEEFSETNITITCVITQDLDSYCYSNDGYDSIVKTFYISKYPYASDIDESVYLGSEGTYRVLNPATNDSIEIELSFGNYYELYDYVKISNFDGLGTNSLDSTKKITEKCFRQINFESTNALIYSQSISGSIERKMGGKVNLKFKSHYLPNVFEPPVIQEWNYVGRKIN